MIGETIVFDCETIRAIPTASGGKLEGFEYCDGWRDFAGMGISVVCAYDEVERRHRIFCEDNRDELADLIAARQYVAGFNSMAFDEPLLAACWDITIPPEKSYDMLVEIWAAAGLGPIYQSSGHSGYGLDACCLANLKTTGKAGNGALAPIWWQRGQVGRVIDYCQRDVEMLKDLLVRTALRASLGGPNEFNNFVCPKTHKMLNVRLPWQAGCDKVRC